MEVVGNIVDDLAIAVLYAPFDEGWLHSGDEHAVRPDAVEQLVAKDGFAGHRGRFEVVDFQVVDRTGFGPGRKRVKQRRRLGDRHAHRQRRARRNAHDGLVRRSQLRLVLSS